MSEGACTCSHQRRMVAAEKEGVRVFTFFRTRSGPAEFWEILLEKNAVPEAEQRFGRPLAYRTGKGTEDMTYHPVGTLVAVVTGDEAEFLLAHKELSVDEQRKLAQQLELLFGHEVWSGGGEVTKGYFLHDSLKAWTSAPGVE